jgi:hypothetical protein
MSVIYSRYYHFFLLFWFSYVKCGFNLRSANKRVLSKSSLEVTKKNRPTINLLEKPHDKKTTYIGTCYLKIPVSPTLTKYTLYTHFYSCRIYNTIILCIIFFFYYSVIIFIYYHHKQWEMVVVEETR